MVFLFLLAFTGPSQTTPPPSDDHLPGTWVIDKQILLEATLVRINKELGKPLTDEERKMVAAEVEKTAITIVLKPNKKATYQIDMGDGSKPIDGIGRWYVEGNTVSFIIRYKWGIRLEPSQRMVGMLDKGVIRLSLARGMPEITLLKQVPPKPEKAKP